MQNQLTPKLDDASAGNQETTLEAQFVLGGAQWN